MANKVFNYYKELPSWAKGIVVIGGIAIVYFTSKSIIKRIRASNDTKEERKTIDEQKNETQVLIDSGVKPTFSESQYRQWADALQKQFDGCDPSLSVAWLSSYMMSSSGAYLGNIVMQFKNDVDFLKLNTAYGIRTYDQCGWGTGDFTGTLPQAVRDELDGDEIKNINKELAKRGITYKF